MTGSLQFGLLFLLGLVGAILQSMILATTVVGLSCVVFAVQVRREFSPPLLILLCLNVVYFFTRVFFLLVYGDYAFGGWVSDSNFTWLLVYTAFNLFFYMGFSSIEGMFGSKTFQVPRSRFDAQTLWQARTVGIVSYCIAVICFAYYLSLVGIAGYVANFSVDGFLFVAGDAFLSKIKNIMNWALFAGFALISVTTDFTRPRKLVSYFLVAAVTVVVAATFARRGHMLVIVLMAYCALRDSGFNMRRPAIYLVASAIATLLYGVYVLRKFGFDEYFLMNAFEGLNSGEFWIFDQFNLVVQNVGHGIEQSNGIEHIKMFFFFLTPFERYMDSIGSVGMQLVWQVFQIEGWGVPPSIYGYAVLAFGLEFQWLYAFVLGGAFGALSMGLKRISTSELRVLGYMCLSVFTWYFFRSGDPLLAAYYCNRWMLMTYGAIAVILFATAKRRSFTNQVT